MTGRHIVPYECMNIPASDLGLSSTVSGCTTSYDSYDSYDIEATREDGITASGK